MAFNVDKDGLLQPLGVTVLRDNRMDLLPGTRDYFESIPGRDGEFDFGCDFEGQILELHCVAETTRATWYTLRNTIAGYLNPKLGAQDLTFADEPGAVYRVRYSGSISLTLYPFAREFTIPFKMCNPHRLASTQSLLEGTGTAVNAGNDETPCIVEIVGPVTNPTVKIGSLEMKYTGLVTVSDKLIIDTEKLTATFNGANALANYNGVFPNLAIGNNAVTAASAGATTVKWYNRWI
jgi:phage-related protein